MPPLSSPFYRNSNVGAMQKVVDDKQELNTVDAIVASVGPAQGMIKARIVGSSNLINLEISRDVSVEQGDRIILQRATAVNRWVVTHVYTLRAGRLGILQQSPTAGNSNAVVAPTGLTTVPVANVGIIVYWSVPESNPEQIYILEVADDTSGTNAVLYTLSGSYFIVPVTPGATKKFRVQSVGLDFAKSGWSEWVSATALANAYVTSVTGTVPIHSSGGLTPDISVDTFTGDTGTGGLRGVVPAPAGGDAAAGKVLGAGGGWVVVSSLSSPLTTKGDLWGYDTGNNRVPVGSAHTFLSPNSGAALGLSYRAVDVSSADITGILVSSSFPALTGVVQTTAGSLVTSFPSSTGSGAVVLQTAPTINSPTINTAITGSAISTDGTFATQSDTIVPSQKAIYTYVNAVAQGLSVKYSVQAATTAALPSNTYSNGSSGVGATLTGTATGVLTVDGHTVALNDRVLVKNESAQAHNGIYLCTVAGAVGAAYVLTRTTDSDTAAKLAGAFVFVEDTSTANAGSGFVSMTDSSLVIGTGAIAFTQFSGAGEITFNAPLTKSGNVVSLTTPLAANYGGTGQDFSASTGIIHVASGVMSASAVDVSGSDITGVLKASAFPALTGDLATPSGSLSTTLANSGVTAGTYLKVTVDSKGRVTAGLSLLSSDIPNLPAAGVSAVILAPCYAVSSSNVTVSSPGTATFDGVTLSSGQRLLLQGQSTLSQNGPWIFNGSSSALTRPIDFPSGGTTQAFGGVLVPVLPLGTVNGGSWYYISTYGITITIDTTLFTISKLDANINGAIGTLALTSLTNGGTSGQPLLAGASVPAYGALDYNNTSATKGLEQQQQVISSNLTIAAGYSVTTAYSLEVQAGVVLTIGSGGYLRIT